MNTTSRVRHVAAIALLAFAATASANRYRLVDLGLENQPNQINDRGELAGIGSTGGFGRAIVAQRGPWHPLPADDQSSAAYAINNHGAVGGDIDLWPTIWSPDHTAHALNMPPGTRTGDVMAIADDGRSAGSYSAHQSLRCFLATADGKARNLQFPGRVCRAWAMNGHGQIVGQATFSRDADGFLWQDGQFTDLGVLPGTTGGAFALSINERGDIVGSSGNPEAHPVIWRDGAVSELADLSGYADMQALSINDRGDIVGAGGLAVTHLAVALRFENGRSIPLSSEVANLGNWTLSIAESINNDGVIVGVGEHDEGLLRGFLLIPMDPSDP